MAHPETGFDPDRYPWAAWRPEDVARRLTGTDVPWYVAAGWSIDLFLGRETREHEDLEIAVPSARFDEIAEVLDELEFFALNNGTAHAVEHEPEALVADDSHQTWGLDRDAGAWRLDVFREPSDGETWICRRDESIRLSRGEQVEWSDDGIPYSRPELTLLFKAKHARPKDDLDLRAVLAVLPPQRRRYLADLLATVHPGHRWLSEVRVV